jgi:hypothetical protein
LLFERPLLGDNATWHQSQPQRRDCTQSKDSSSIHCIPPVLSNNERVNLAPDIDREFSAKQ